MQGDGVSLGDERRVRLAAARLYLVCGATGDGRDLRAFLDAALRGGVDVVQLREKDPAATTRVLPPRASSATRATRTARCSC